MRNEEFDELMKWRNCLTQYAKDYLKENDSKTDARVKEAVLVDSIYYLIKSKGEEFAIFTEELHDENKYDDKVEPKVLIPTIVNVYSYYLFDQNHVESVTKNSFMTNYTEQFDPNIGANVLIDFINYILERNECDKRFTIKVLYEKYNELKHESEIKELREFLELTGKFSEKIKKGISIDEIYDEIKEEHFLKHETPNRTYYYKRPLKEKGQIVMTGEDAEKVDTELEALSYALAKSNTNLKSKRKTVEKRIARMKRND